MSKNMETTYGYGIYTRLFAVGCIEWKAQMKMFNELSVASTTSISAASSQ
jgi:hypothetical protein